MSDRSVDDHPADRWSDRSEGWKKIPAWVWHHKIYRDVWLLAITISIFLGFQAIHDSRIDASVRACEDTNGRHVESIIKLDLLYQNVVSPDKLALIKKADTPAEIAVLPKALRQPASSYQGTVGLISALVPSVVDCRARAEKLVNP